MGTLQRLASHASIEDTRYCATAPKITDPRTPYSLVLLLLDGHTTHLPAPATGHHGLLVPSNGALPAFLPPNQAACTVEWAAGIQ